MCIKTMAIQRKKNQMTKKTQTKRIFGIDLGTTYSSIAYVDEFGKAVIIPNAESEREGHLPSLPSILSFPTQQEGSPSR